MNYTELHKLEIYLNPVGLSYVGVCGCSDPDYDEGAWTGSVEFHEFSKDAVREAHFNHVLEVTE